MEITELDVFALERGWEYFPSGDEAELTFESVEEERMFRSGFTEEHFSTFGRQRRSASVEGGLQVVPTTLREANRLVSAFHRHNGPTARNGGKFALAITFDGHLVGAAIVGNPLSATFMDGFTAEVLRVCVLPEAPKGACSKLYSACWSAWKAMGGRRLLTYTLTEESGASLRGAGWVAMAESQPTREGWHKNDHLRASRTWAPVMGMKKIRWEVRFG